MTEAQGDALLALVADQHIEILQTMSDATRILIVLAGVIIFFLAFKLWSK